MSYAIVTNAISMFFSVDSWLISVVYALMGVFVRLGHTPRQSRVPE